MHFRGKLKLKFLLLSMGGQATPSRVCRRGEGTPSVWLEFPSQIQKSLASIQYKTEPKIIYNMNMGPVKNVNTNHWILFKLINGLTFWERECTCCGSSRHEKRREGPTFREWVDYTFINNFIFMLILAYSEFITWFWILLWIVLFKWLELYSIVMYFGIWLLYRNRLKKPVLFSPEMKLIRSLIPKHGK